ncbi:hypothetical protein PoB_001932000 [Plakobranchus ocellatus]|uniref:Uncharacterized protein n=1 Tax=Plakobranchus ocellatus TaxID=259542 RepID=A0AAV3ZE23_9GAST|nr:hypothetical protein PoB_001932000 [Plakobranchus ocellatus]
MSDGREGSGDPAPDNSTWERQADYEEDIRTDRGGESGSTAPDNSSRGRIEDRKVDSRHSSIHHISVGRMKTEDTSLAF